MLFTGAHADYHKPSDTWEKVNGPGLARIGRFAAALIDSLDRRPRVTYVQSKSGGEIGRIAGGGGYGAYLGTIPDYLQTEGGVLLSGVRHGGPAENAGLRGGDVIIKFDGVRIDNIYDYTYALRSRKPGQASVRRARGVGAVCLLLAAVCAASLVAGRATGLATATGSQRPPLPLPAANADSLIREGERHFAHLWQLTFGGENAEGYWSADGRKLIFQSTRDGWPCDQMFVLDLESGGLNRVSTGKGRTTCGYFYDHDRRVLFSSTHLEGDSCPPPPDYSQGYVWPLAPYDIFTTRPDGSDLRRLTDSPGYDAEATVSADERRIVFTSTRDGDLDIYTMNVDGTNLKRLTDRLGYDGGPFFSRDGRLICYRAAYPADSAEAADYRRLLANGLVRPSHMDLWVMRADGSNKRQVTDKPGASFAPYFTPDAMAIIYSSNWENPRGRNFDLYLVPIKGGEPEAVTRDASFDGFPMFSPNGRWLVFASNRGAKARGETNLFLAEWLR
jgi:Tol biopolymer transport system component